MGYLKNKQIHYMKYQTEETQLWVYDTEDDSKGKLILAVFYNGTDYEEFYNIEDIHLFLDTIGKAHIWCHNLEYDLNNVFIDEYESFLTRTYFAGRLIYASVPFYNHNYSDFFNHMAVSLDKVGELMKMKKVDYDFDGRLNKKKLLAHCRRDCEILWAGLERLIDFYDKGGVPNSYQSPVIKPLRLTKEEKVDLKKFLRSLTGENNYFFGNR